MSGDALEDDFYAVDERVYEDVLIHGKSAANKMAQKSSSAGKEKTNIRAGLGSGADIKITSGLGKTSQVRTKRTREDMCATAPPVEASADGIPLSISAVVDECGKNRDADQEPSDSPTTKKKKNKKRRTLTDADRRLPRTNAAAMERYFWQRLMLDHRQVTSLEERDLLEHVKLSQSDLSMVEADGVGDEATLDKLAEFLKRAMEQFPASADASSTHGQPRLLIVTSSAVRAVDLIRAVRPLSDGRPVAKLFAKHYKVDEQLAFLRAHIVDIAIGTPNRIAKLQEETTVKQDAAVAPLLDHVQWLVVDGSYRDQKQQTLFDIRECRKDFFEVLMRETGLRERVRSGKVKMIVY